VLHAELPAGGVDCGTRRRAGLPADPRHVREITRSQPSRLAAHQHDLVLDERLGLELVGESEAADDRELDGVRTDELQRGRRRRHADIEVDVAEGREHARQQVRPRDARRSHGERAAALDVERPTRVREQRLGPQDVVGEDSAGLGERRAAAATVDEDRAELGLERGDVLRDGRLADIELGPRAREGAGAGDCGEGAEPGFDLHHQEL
jgi:hypothetical protein